MRKLFSLFAVIFGLLLLSPISASAADYNVKIVDDANILSNQEVDDLTDYLESLDNNINYLVVTSYDRNMGGSALEKLDNYYKREFDAYQDGIAFIIDMDTRRIEMQGRNNYEKRITAGDCYDITDNVYSYASNEDYYGCIYQAFRQANLVANYKNIIRPMRFIVSFFIAVILGFLLNFFKAMYDRSHQNEIKGVPEMFLLGATFTGLANVYESKKSRIREQHYSSGSGGNYHSSGGSFSSGGGGGFSSSGGGGGFSSGGHSF